jgi:hypothetical protein
VLYPGSFLVYKGTINSFFTKPPKRRKIRIFLPLVGDEFIKQGKENVSAISTSALWFGVTYQ